MMKVPESAYEKWKISVVICYTDVRNGKPSHGGDRKSFRRDDFNLTNRNPWFSSFLISGIPLSMKC